MSHTWTKRFGASNVDNVEAIGSDPSSDYFMILASGNSITNVYWLVRISKSSGSTNK